MKRTISILIILSALLFSCTGQFIDPGMLEMLGNGHGGGNWNDDDDGGGNWNDDDDGGDTFVAVSSITGVPTTGTFGTELTLSGTVNPSNATNKTIVWSLGTGSTAAGAAVSAGKATATGAGNVVVTATIVNGKTASSNYTQDFTITFSGGTFVPVSYITGIPQGTAGTAGTEFTLSGTVNPSNATNKTIVWSLGTGSTAAGASVSEGKAHATGAGTVVVKATIVNGLTETSNFTQDFTITFRIRSLTWKTLSGAGFNWENIYGIAYGGDKFVAVGDSGKMAYSSDGIIWDKLTYNSISTIYGITYGGGKFVAGGSSGKMAYSSDGITWTAVTDSTFGTTTIIGIAYGGGKFVAVGSSKKSYSSDGITWTAVADSSTRTNGIAYGGGKFVAVGDSGRMTYSSDGITWTAVTDSKFDFTTIRCITYGGGKFVAVGDSGKTAYSSDGITWTAVTQGTLFRTINDIAYGGDKFIAVGSSGQFPGDFGQILYSSDGITWTGEMYSTFATTDINGIAYGDGKFVAVGDSGEMAYADSW